MLNLTLWCRVGGLIPTGMNVFLKKNHLHWLHCNERAHQMAYVKSDNNREKNWWMLCCMKTNGVNIPGKHRWHCVCESSLGSEKLWIHAGSQGAILDQSIWRVWQVAFWVLLLALHTISQCSTQSGAEQKKKEENTGQNLLRPKL